MKALIAASALVLATSSCSTFSKVTGREPSSLAGVTHIQKIGEACELDLDGDTQPEKIEIGKGFGSRVLLIMHPSLHGKPAQYFVEALAESQSVDCIANKEPGAPFAGTDETEKAVNVTMKADYLKVATPEKDARFVYFDSSLKAYKNVWRAD